jgi:hypothetical protein
MQEHYPGETDIHSCPCISIDVRGSSRQTGDPRYLDRVQKPFETHTYQALCNKDGFLENFRGDELRGLYPRGFSGDDNAKKAWNTALSLLQNPPINDDGERIPLGVAIHIGPVQIYSRGEPPAPFGGCGVSGPGITLCSLLCQEAGPYEALISDVVLKEANIQSDSLEPRLITLKKSGDEIPVHVVSEENAKTFEYLS